MARFMESIKIFGNIAAIFNFIILMGLVVTVYILVNSDDADLFPSPLVYLDAQTNAMGNLFYPPVNGEAFCLGDEVLWEKNARYTRSTSVQRSYYLQIQRPYRFTGPRAEQLMETYGADAKTTRALYSSVLPATHVTEGLFEGGLQVYALPTADQLRPHEGIQPGDALRIYVDVEAPFSQSTGYYVPFKIAENCPVVEPTARQGMGELGVLQAQK